MNIKKLLIVFLAAVLFLVILWIVIGGTRILIFSRRGGVLISKARPYEQKGKGQSILVLGDSLAYGTGASSPQTSVAGLLAARFPDASVTNKAANGKRTHQLADEIDMAIDKKYDIILIIVGGNDIIHPQENLSNTKKNLQKIYSTASQNSSHVIALTTGNLKYTSLFLWPLNHYFGRRSVVVKNAAKEAVAILPNVTYVDIIDRNERVKFDDLKEADDHLHLSDDGAQYWFDGILEATNNLKFE